MQVTSESSEAVLRRKDTKRRTQDSSKDDYQKAADEALLARYAPVGVVVNEQLNIVQFRGATGAYLEAPSGKATHQVLKMVREGLAFELRNALHKAKQTNETITTNGITLDQDKRKVDIAVIPLQHTIEPYFLILFSDADPGTRRKPKKKWDEAEKPAPNHELLRIEELQKELVRLHQNMRGITEHQEGANEELQSANEDLLASSEELQSLNEELEQQVAERTRELKEANIQLQRSNENLQQFASIASHDLQEPLRKIKTFASTLNRRFSSGLPDEGKEVADKIGLAASRMSLLISELLKYSKLAHASRDFTPTNLNAVVRSVLSDLDLLVMETGAVINYPKPLPVVNAVPLQMNQLFYVIINALKFHKQTGPLVLSITYCDLPAGEIKGFSQLSGEQSYIEMIFSDNGIGFEKQFAEQIFQLFERLHSLDEYEGTGVGLALCKKVVENHQGHIFALSKEHEGAEFHVILPVKDEQV